MSDPSRSPIPPRAAGTLALLALAVGLIGDLLLRAQPWGLSFPLWVGAAAGVAAWRTATTRGTPVLREAAWYLPALGFAACVAWRDAPQLTAWNVLGTALALLLPALRTRVASLVVAPIGAYLIEPVRTGLAVALGPLVAATEEVAWDGLALRPAQARATRVAVGLALAVPVAIVFGGLLASADPIFEKALRLVLDWDFATVASHVLLVAFLAWIAAGYLLGLEGKGALHRLPAPPRRRPALGLLELAIPLGVLVVLFAGFVVIQARYLFGGQALVQATVGLTFADYARRGFFELIAVAGLLLPVLLAVDWLVDAGRAGAERGVRALSGALLLLTAPIVASALQRMRIYVDAYGLSTDRVYALTVMAWVVLALAWFALTVLRGARERFAFGALVAGFAVLAALNAVDPDRTVARVNLERAAAGRDLDAAYLLRLGADAMPVVLAGLPALPEAAPACETIDQVRQRWTREELDGWRRWNLGRARARTAVRETAAAWAARCAAAALP